MAKAIRGMMLDPDGLLMVVFPVNPMVIEIEKEVKYESETPTGHDGSIITYVSGGKKMLKYSLMFDRTDSATSSGFQVFSIPLIGVEGVEAVFESFLKPKKTLLDLIIPPTIVKPPPDCLIVMGLRFWQCKLTKAPFKEKLHDFLLTPKRVYIDIEAEVNERTSVNDANDTIRIVEALLESTVGSIATELTLFL